MAARRSSSATSAAKSVAPAISADTRILILHGSERFLQLEWTNQLREALEAAHGEVETFLLDGRSLEAATVLDELRMVGLLGRHKLVVIEEAHAFLAGGGDGTKRNPSNRQLMEEYAESPSAAATLVLRAPEWRPGKLDKAVAQVGTVVKCDEPKPAQAAAWVRARATKRHGAAVEPAAADLLVDRVGTELARLDAEVAKLASMIATNAAAQADTGEGDVQPVVTVEHVKAMVGPSREEKAWAIQDALLSGRADVALHRLEEITGSGGQPDLLVLAAFEDLALKLHAACRMRAAGASPQAIRKDLRLWGASANAIPAAAERVRPATLRRLVDASIEADRRSKRGIGEPHRDLEVLAIRFADTLGGGRRR